VDGVPSSDERARWDARYAEEDVLCAPSAVLTSPPLVDWVPTSGRALDLAGGAGRHAVWLAARGLTVTIADVSPVGLARAEELARARGVHVDTQAVDLSCAPLPAGPWDFVLVFHYLERAVLASIADALSPQGTLVVVHPTLRNLERHARPSARFLLEEGELRALVGGLEVSHYEEGWSVEGRHEATLVARRG
jgi:tellurite methyltransferase